MSDGVQLTWLTCSAREYLEKEERGKEKKKKKKKSPAVERRAPETQNNMPPTYP
jgi:hypothetical protein